MGAQVKTVASGLQVSERFLDDVRMSDWQRLGKYVVSRRVKLGYKQRADIAAAVGVSTRVMSDIENGKRGNFDSVTVASLEEVLGWETGSVATIAAGGEPTLRGQAFSHIPMKRNTASLVTQQIEMIYRSQMSALDKLEAIRMVLELHEQAIAEAGVAEGQGTAFDATVETSNNG